MSFSAASSFASRGPKAMFDTVDQWRRSRKPAQNSSDPVEPPEGTSTTPPPHEDEEVTLPSISVGGGASGGRAGARTSSARKPKVSLTPRTVLPRAPVAQMSPAMRLSRFINPDPADQSKDAKAKPERGITAKSDGDATAQDSIDAKANSDRAVHAHDESDHAKDESDDAHSEVSDGEKSDNAHEPEPEPEPRDDTSDSTSVGDQIAAEEPAEWDPPFSPPPPRRPSMGLRRSARHSSPVEAPTPQDTDHEQDQDEVEVQGDEKRAEPEPKVEDDKPEREQRWIFRSIKDHRISSRDPNLFDLLISWVSPDDEESWEPEESIHQDAPRDLFRYWKSVGGREAFMKDPGLWHIASVKKHRLPRGRPQMLVSWVGSEEESWEPEETVAESAPAALETYWEEKGGREKCVGGGGSKKRKRAAVAPKKTVLAKRTRSKA
ncbi:uncharacterized protein DNG_09199 [Cephalotrichum gorgonifer]|uniref:Chromo domain-containing protein n=1 Tax=Cephalotrichum gorgonifer TaxID=2041049 RepID=A0AAE8SZ50_9PEZI|nr:uncharacterized protein DNG_09199 [Cephalotrichum gorgonifer]